MAFWLFKEAEEENLLSEKEIGNWPPLPPNFMLAMYVGLESGCNHPEEINILYNIYSKPNSIVEEIKSYSNLDNRLLANLIVLAAARPLLLTSATNALGWIEAAQTLLGNKQDYLFDICEEMKAFTLTGGTLERSVLRQVLLKEDWVKGAMKAQDELQRWQEQTKAKRLTFQPAGTVLKYIIGMSEVSKIVEIVSGERYRQVTEVQNFLRDHLVNRSSMDSFIQNASKQAHKNRAVVPYIDGKALDQLVTILEKLQEILIDWVDAVGVERAKSKMQDTMETLTSQLHHNLQKWIEQTLNDISQEPKTGDNLWLSFIRQMYLRFRENTLDCERLEDGYYKAWKDNLKRPLLLLENPPIDNSGFVDPLDTLGSSGKLYVAIKHQRSLTESLDLHLQNQDFMLADLIVKSLENENYPEVSQIQETIQDKLQEAQRYQKRRIEHIKSKIEKATLEHILTEDKRTLYHGILLSLEESNSNRLSSISVEMDKIEDELKDLREERISSLKQNIAIIIGELNARSSDDTGITQAAYMFINKSQEALQSGDIPLADEYLHYAELAIDRGIEVDVASYQFDGNPVEEFIAIINELHRYLQNEENRNPRGVIDKICKAIENRSSIAGLEMYRVPGARAEEIRTGMNAWLELKRTPRTANSRAWSRSAGHLTKILEYIGFERINVKLVDEQDSGVYFNAQMSAGQLSPIADFGSLRNEKYELVVVKRTSEDRIGQIIDGLGIVNRSPIVMYLGRMTEMQRKEWSSYCRKKNLTALLIDELLLYYLASQRSSRLPAAISCGVAWGYIRPYRSFGVIPHEIFKGRRHMVSELGKSSGSCIVYGGRQLGKSALLRMVQREYDKPNIGAHVILEDIKSFGDPQSVYQTNEIWSRLKDHLANRGIVSSKTSDARENISKQIIQKFTADSNLQVTVLLDEADNFLHADSLHNFNEVLELRRIMDQTERRFRVVFCGLHGVQRYCRLENHPFAQLMDQPVVVGPLEPSAAQLLITEPMTAIGFSFASEEAQQAVLRILCYTNYHPALIQYFCSELIEIVRKHNSEPPYSISIVDVEKVYKREDVRSFMRERFNWTLDLDPRYQGFIYSMVVDQLKEHD